MSWDGVPDMVADANEFPGDFFDGDVPGRARGLGVIFTDVETQGRRSPPARLSGRVRDAPA